MFQLDDIHWAQLTLIQIGVFFQLVAIGAYLYDAGARRQMKRHLDELERTEREEQKSQFMEQAQPHRPRRLRGEGFDEPMGDRIKGRGLTRTTKTHFRQTFNFHRHGT